MEQDNDSLCSSEVTPPKTHKPQSGMMKISLNSPNQEESQQTTPKEAKTRPLKPIKRPNGGPHLIADSPTAPCHLIPTQHLQN